MPRESFTLGMCLGDADPDFELKFPDTESVSAAFLAPVSATDACAGNQLTSARVFLVSKISTDNLQVWVRETPDGEDLVHSDVIEKAALEKGWNDIVLPPLTIEKGKTYYIGYTYSQRRAANAISLGGISRPGSFFVRTADMGWDDRSSEGALAMEAYVTGETLPRTDAFVLDCNVSSPIIKAGSPLSIWGHIANTGLDTFDDLTLRCSVDGMQSFEIRGDLNKSLTPGERGTYRFAFIPETDGDNQDLDISVEVLHAGAEDDVIDYNNIVATQFSTVPELYVRKTLFEDFSTEKCGNCPKNHEMVHEAIADGYQDKVIQIVRHSGYGEDQFTGETDRILAETFKVSASPMAVLNRTYCDDQNQWHRFINNARDFHRFIDMQNEKGTDVEVNIDAWFDPDGKRVNVRVYGDVRAMSLADPRVTVSILEDNVYSERQYFGSGYGEFYHMALVRASNSVWGDPVTVEDGRYSYSTSFEFDRTNEKLADFRIVAFINGYSETTERSEMNVLNANKFDIVYAPVGEAYRPSGIESVSTEHPYEPDAWYTITGLRLGSRPATPGLYIHKGRKIVI